MPDNTKKPEYSANEQADALTKAGAYTLGDGWMYARISGNAFANAPICPNCKSYLRGKGASPLCAAFVSPWDGLPISTYIARSDKNPCGIMGKFFVLKDERNDDLNTQD